jgi:cobyrinic acid a,c-diamide synthase
MYLAEELTVDGARHEMCGALPVAADFPGPLELAYCEVTTRGGPLGEGNSARGHWFHNGRLRSATQAPPAYDVKLASGAELQEGCAAGNTVGSWVHLHFRSCPAVAEAFVDAAAMR